MASEKQLKDVPLGNAFKQALYLKQEVSGDMSRRGGAAARCHGLARIHHASSI